MSQYVIEFGAPAVHPIVDAMRMLLDQVVSLDILFESGASASSTPSEHALETAYSGLAGGEIASLTIRTNTAGIRYGLILKPHFADQDLSMWMGTLEVTTEEWRPYWYKLLRCDELAFVCVGDEEGIDLTDKNISVESFPWKEWPLIAGAVRASGGKDWIIREPKEANDVPVI